MLYIYHLYDETRTQKEALRLGKQSREDVISSSSSSMIMVMVVVMIMSNH